VALAACFVYFIIKPETKLLGSYNLLPALFLAFWFSYNAITLFWAQDTHQVVAHMVAIALYGVMFLVYSNLFRVETLLSKFNWFLVFIVALYLITCIWELITWQHLPVSRYYQKLHFIPTGPFLGENMTAAYFLMFTPFILFISKLTNRTWHGVIAGIVTLGIFVIVTIQGARIALLAYFGLFTYYFFWHMKWKAKLTLLLIFILIGGAAYMVFQNQIDIMFNVLKHQTETIGGDTESIHMSSIKIRTQMLFESIDIAFSTGLMGVGGGNFEDAMNTDRLFRTAWITNPHNYLMEIFGNWGILILGGFLTLYIWWLYRLFVLYRYTEDRQRYLYLMYLSSLVLFIPASILPSSIRSDYFIWIYFAAVNAICLTKLPAKSHKLLSPQGL
jgi:teichuronic acid biosynthesis protein TuaE